MKMINQKSDQYTDFFSVSKPFSLIEELKEIAPGKTKPLEKVVLND